MTYGYDRYGNRTTVNVSGADVDGSVIPPDGLQNVNYDPATNHALNPAFSYDAAGNVTRSLRVDGSWSRYRYDSAGRLAAVLTDAGVILESYFYSFDDHRLVTDNPGASGRRTYYAWDGSRVIAEYRMLTPGGDPIWAKSTVYLGDWRS